MRVDKRFYRITYEQYWGTRWPRHYYHAYVYATSRSDAVRRFNKNHARGERTCRKVSEAPLPTSLEDIPGWFTIEPIDILDYPGV